jgi:hypothetical protein
LPFLSRVRATWNAFLANDQPGYAQTMEVVGGGPITISRPDRPRMRRSSEATILASILTRIAVDVSGVELRHVQFDEFNRYADDIQSKLNDCLTWEANLDQAPRAFRQDIAMTLFDSGVAAIVPVDTDVNPETNEVFDIETMRVGRVTAWYPAHVRVSLYNEAKGYREEILLEKRYVALVENPLYSVMNEPNSTLQRLIRKLNLLDVIDGKSGSDKLDLIIQLPYNIRGETKTQQAKQRLEDIESQLSENDHGIAYVGNTEKIIQLNRPVENNLLAQIEFLFKQVYGELGITEAIMNGTADEKAMNAYFDRTIEPVVDAIIEAMQRSFLGKKGKERKERIRYFRNPFKFMTLAELADIADKFTRSEILTSNEFRGFLGIPPSKDPRADSLANPNMPHPENALGDGEDPTLDALDDIDSTITSIFDELGVKEPA